MARSTIILVLSFALTAVAPPFTKGPRANEPASDVPGASFNRIFQIWMENVDFEVAAADENMKWLAENGILLTNFYAGKPSSHPNYVAAVGGDTFGLQNDNVNNIPANVSTVVDLLDYKGISWAEYMEGIPSAGYQGSRSGNYVRKHNPLITYDSVSKNSTRLERIKSLADFDHDLSNNMLPQWAFFAPDIKNDSHDTGIGYGARWLRGWLEPLLKNDHFMNGTLVIVTFDEDGSYDKINRVYTVLLGGAIDPALRGTTDSMYFNHYSAISSVSANWDLPSLGRWDCNANIFSSVANRTNYRNTNISSYEGLWWNVSYPGPLNKKETTPGWWPRPATDAKCVSGRGTLPSVASTWGSSSGSYNYSSVYPYDDSFGPTRGGVRAVGANAASSSADAPHPTPTVSGAVGATRGHLIPNSIIVSGALALLLGAG